MNNKSKLNLYCQKSKASPYRFEVLKKEGSDHRPTFQVSCTFENCVQVGEGPSLKSAKESAAQKIVQSLDIDLKLKEFENEISYDIESYNASLSTIWENENENENEYILTLKKKDKNKQIIEYKKFKVKILHLID